MTTLDSRVRMHYERFLGPPSEVEEVTEHDSRGPDLQVLEWGRAAEGIWFYATIGLSRTARGGDEPSHRIELTVPISQRNMDLALRLIGAAVVVDAPLAPGHVIRMADEVNGMSHLLVSRPWGEDEEFEELSVDGAHVQFLMLVPIYESEYRYLREHGEGALWDAFAAENVEYPNFTRAKAKLSQNVPSARG